MVKLKYVTTGTLQPGNCVTAILQADTKGEVGPSMTVVGLPAGCTLDMGSYVVTADFQVGSLKSDDTWEWV